MSCYFGDRHEDLVKRYGSMARRFPATGSTAAFVMGKVIFPSSMDIRMESNKFVVHSDTVGQFTGLTDRTEWDELTAEEQKFWLRKHEAEEWTGRLIFEGDIVEGMAYSSLWRGVIVWINEIAGFGIRYQKRDDPTAWEDASILKRLRVCKDQFAAKVIGNIYDNPNLLDNYDNT